MPYFIRIFGQKNPNIHLDDLYKAVAERKINGVNLEITGDKTAADWDLLLVKKGRGKVLAQIERNTKSDLLMGDEIEEFREDIAQAKPQTTVQWLNAFFDKTEVIYAFQIEEKAFEDDNYEVIDALHSVIRGKTQGITQDDETGFMNERGYYILWYEQDEEGGGVQFGELPVAVLDSKGNWQGFDLDMKNEQHWKTFLAGKVIS